MFGKSVVKVIILLLLLPNAFGGILGPGRYAGVVIYDQWDTCYLYAGVYLMYITDKKKEKLRDYEGMAVVVDAKEVIQPINPGDGLITKFEVIEKLSELQGAKLKLTATPKFEAKNEITFELKIENLSGKTIVLETSDFAPTLLGEKNPNDFFSPSDGKSEALITRCSLENARQWQIIKSLTVTNVQGDITSSKKFSIGGGNSDSFSFPPSFELLNGQSTQFTVSLDIPSGTYDFLFGYSEGVHEGITLISNRVSFSVHENGKASIMTSTPPRKDTIGVRNLYPMNFLLGEGDHKGILNFQIYENTN